MPLSLSTSLSPGRLTVSRHLTIIKHIFLCKNNVWCLGRYRSVLPRAGVICSKGSELLLSIGIQCNNYTSNLQNFMAFLCFDEAQVTLWPALEVESWHLFNHISSQIWWLISPWNWFLQEHKKFLLLSLVTLFHTRFATMDSYWE